MRKMGQIEPFKIAILISFAVHFFLIILLPEMKVSSKPSPEYLEVSLIRVPPKSIGAEARQVVKTKKPLEVKKITVFNLSPLKKPPLPGPKLPILAPSVKVQDEMEVSVPTPKLDIPLKKDMESSPHPPRFFREKGTVGVEGGVPEEGYFFPRAVLPSGEEELFYEEKEEAQPEGARFKIKGPVGTRRLLRVIEPEYPEWAEKQGIEGIAELKFWVLSSGEVRPDIEVMRTSGWAKLDECAAQALRQWRFGSIQEKEVQWGIIPIPFEFGRHLRE